MAENLLDANALRASLDQNIDVPEELKLPIKNLSDQEIEDAINKAMYDNVYEIIQTVLDEAASRLVEQVEAKDIQPMTPSASPVLQGGEDVNEKQYVYVFVVNDEYNLQVANVYATKEGRDSAVREYLNENWGWWKSAFSQDETPLIPEDLSEAIDIFNDHGANTHSTITMQSEVLQP